MSIIIIAGGGGSSNKKECEVDCGFIIGMVLLSVFGFAALCIICSCISACWENRKERKKKEAEQRERAARRRLPAIVEMTEIEEPQIEGGVSAWRITNQKAVLENPV